MLTTPSPTLGHYTKSTTKELLSKIKIHHEEFTALLKLARNAENSFKITKP